MADTLDLSEEFLAIMPPAEIQAAMRPRCKTPASRKVGFGGFRVLGGVGFWGV